MIGMNFTKSSDFDSLPPEVTHVRLWDVGVHWGAIHLGPGLYDWSLLDELVEKSGDRHITYVIGGTPLWLAKNPDNPHYAPWLGPGSNSMPSSMDESNKFVWELAHRYKGKINAYEVWNEPQLADFFYPYTISECIILATMTKRFYSTIKAVDPSAQVLAAAILPRESSGGMKRARKYLAAMKHVGWNVDAFTTHIYPDGITSPDQWRIMLSEVAHTLKVMGAPRKKLWVTETGFGLLEPAITNKSRIINLVDGVSRSRPVFYYAWNRPDLGGVLVAPDSTAWEVIKSTNPQ